MIDYKNIFPRAKEAIEIMDNDPSLIKKDKNGFLYATKLIPEVLEQYIDWYNFRIKDEIENGE